MTVGEAYVFPGFLTPVLTQLFFPKPPTTFLTMNVDSTITIFFITVNGVIQSRYMMNPSPNLSDITNTIPYFDPQIYIEIQEGDFINIKTERDGASMGLYYIIERVTWVVK